MKTKEEIIEEFKSLDFDEPEMRKRMKYLVVSRGDLDINNARAFESKKDLEESIDSPYGREELAIFEIKDITPVDF